VADRHNALQQNKHMSRTKSESLFGQKQADGTCHTYPTKSTTDKRAGSTHKIGAQH